MKICQHCNNAILSEEETHICEKCGAAYHNSCWNTKGGCSTIGCENNNSVGAVPRKPSFCVNCGTALNEMGLCSVCGAGNTVAAKKKFNLTSKKLMMCIIVAAAVLVLLITGLILFFVLRDTRGAGSVDAAFDTLEECMELTSSDELNVDNTASLLYDSIPDDLMSDFLYAMGYEDEDQKTIIKEAIRECFTDYRTTYDEFKMKKSKHLSGRDTREFIEDYFDDDYIYNFNTDEISEVYEIKYIRRGSSSERKCYIFKYKGGYYNTEVIEWTIDLLEEMC
ncbi:MAG: RING finger protein [Oscillospiraceae bacterium]|nr:RING finger protein [Oscillospiraceae bacterium]